VLDRFRVAELHGCVDVPTGSLESPLGDLTGGEALFTDEEALAADQGWLNLSPSAPPQPAPIGKSHVGPKKSAQAAPGFAWQAVGIRLSCGSSTIAVGPTGSS
jgi:hypothetical protein